MNRREFVQEFVIQSSARAFDAASGKSFDPKDCAQSFVHLIAWANKVYNSIEGDEQVAADNSMPDTRSYLDTVTGANGHG